MNVEEGVALARYTTLGTGGTARAFARPESLAEVEQLLRWGAERGLAVATVGLGSNLLVADEGVDALVLRLGGALAAVEVDGEVVRAGAGAANAVCLGNSLVMSACSERLRHELAERGYHVVTALLPSFLRSGGSAFCLTLRLDLQSRGATARADAAAVA